jgi:hypothetical protein
MQEMMISAYNEWGGDGMKFDQVRKEFKRTLWGEELDNERCCSPVSPPLELEFFHQYEGKKYQCIHCSSEHGVNNVINTEKGTYCKKCFRKLKEKEWI